MSNKIIVAFAAVAMLASTALVPSSASAAPQKQFNNKFINKLPPKTVHPHLAKQVHWQKPIIVRYPVVRSIPVAYAAAKPVAGPCTCLTKQYTPENPVVFKDICTNEAAINAPLPPPQVPQQTGMLQVQPDAQPQTQVPQQQ